MSLNRTVSTLVGFYLVSHNTIPIFDRLESPCRETLRVSRLELRAESWMQKCSCTIRIVPVAATGSEISGERGKMVRPPRLALIAMLSFLVGISTASVANARPDSKSDRGRPDHVGRDRRGHGRAPIRVPEPSSLSLLALGVAAVAAQRRRLGM